MFNVPSFRTVPYLGIQLLKLGEGGPSGNMNIKGNTPISSVYGVGWINGMSPVVGGRALTFSSPSSVPMSAYPTSGIINGLSKTPGAGIIS